MDTHYPDISGSTTKLLSNSFFVCLPFYSILFTLVNAALDQSDTDSFQVQPAPQFLAVYSVRVHEETKRNYEMGLKN